MVIEGKRRASGKSEIVLTTCNSDCGRTCRLRLHISSGVLTLVESGDSPVTAECVTWNEALEKVASVSSLDMRTLFQGQGKPLPARCRKCALLHLRPLFTRR